MARLTDGFDIASGGELDLALQAGVSPDRISFAGPGKRNEELEAAISVGVTVNLESEGEADRALALAEKLGKTPRLAVRVNPDFDLRGSGMRMGGGAKPFGIDARSEEHTSELQSLMRISYAVFCLKKKQREITNT